MEEVFVCLVCYFIDIQKAPKNVADSQISSDISSSSDAQIISWKNLATYLPVFS